MALRGASTTDAAVPRCPSPRQSKARAISSVAVSASADQPTHLQEAVHHAVRAEVAGRDPRRAQTLGVGFRFVAQRVVFGGDDQCRRQPGEILRVDGRDARILGGALVAAIGAVIPGQVVARHEAFGGGHRDRRKRQREVDHRLQQHLMADRDAGVGPQEPAGDCREIPAGTFAAHDHGARHPAELAGVGARPDDGRHCVIECCGERVLRRQAVIDREHAVSGDMGEVAAERVALLDAALHVPTAVEIQDDGSWLRTLRHVEACRNVGVRAGN